MPTATLVISHAVRDLLAISQMRTALALQQAKKGHSNQARRNLRRVQALALRIYDNGTVVIDRRSLEANWPVVNCTVTHTATATATRNNDHA